MLARYNPIPHSISLIHCTTACFQHMQMQDQKQAATTRPLTAASNHDLWGARRLVLVLLGALGLGGTAELLGAVLALLACGDRVSFMGSI
jgi:hypothetical protein